MATPVRCATGWLGAGDGWTLTRRFLRCRWVASTGLLLPIWRQLDALKCCKG